VIEETRDERRDERVVEVRARRDDVVLSWDVPSGIVHGVAARLRSEGWTVDLVTEEGPRRRRFPRIQRIRR
jgi:hypothetical protein